MRLKKREPTLPDSIILPPHRGRHAVALALVALVAVALVCDRLGRRPGQGDDRSRYHDRTFRVARVVDGDTIDIEIPDRGKPFTRIRLWGVDAPEIGRSGRAGDHFGAEATAFAEQTLAGRNVHVVLSPARTRGKYGRLLAYVYLERGGAMFNETLLEEGYAYADLRFDHHYYNQFKAIEQRARKAGRGLWAEVTHDEMPEWKQRSGRRAVTSRSRLAAVEKALRNRVSVICTRIA